MKRATLITIALVAILIALAASPRPLTPVSARVGANPAAQEGVQTVPLFRLFHHKIGIHFYTVDPNRKLEAIAAGWTPEGRRHTSLTRRRLKRSRSTSYE